MLYAPKLGLQEREKKRERESLQRDNHLYTPKSKFLPHEKHITKTNRAMLLTEIIRQHSES
jgi:hypothetical protein